MGEIDHAYDAIDQGVADGDQAVDRAEHQAVDQLLGEIIHVLPFVGRGRGENSRQPMTTRRVVFLAARTGGGNGTGCGLNGLYRASFRGWFQLHSPATPLPPNDRGGTVVPPATNPCALR